jgi:hypothetical protein
MASITSLKKGPPMGMTPWQWRVRVTDAVISSFCLQSKSNQLPERMQTRKVFDAFHVLKNKYPNWLGSLHFEKGANVYVSKGLEDVLFSLGAFGLVTVENHDYRYLRVDPGSKKEMKKQVEEHLSEPDLKVLKGLSDEFASLVKK